MKMNKKGFTLIEMLVVIAIIAVLVAIVVPTVSQSTDKAQAASNAANMRSLKSELAIAYLNGELDTDLKDISTSTDVTTKTSVAAYTTGVVLKQVNGTTGNLTIMFDGKDFTITFGGHNITEWGNYADHAAFT